MNVANGQADGQPTAEGAAKAADDRKAAEILHDAGIRSDDASLRAMAQERPHIFAGPWEALKDIEGRTRGGRLMPTRTKGQPPGDLYSWHHRRRAMRRPLADVLGRSLNRGIRWLTTQEIVDQTRSGFFCEAWFCRRGVTCVEYRHRRHLLYGETYMCTAHGERRAARCHVQIQDPPQEGETR